MLFDLAANAIVDGYYREAVSSFTSTLERFYEFYIQVICEKSNISADVFAAAWNKVAAQSERQLGAFTFLHLIENQTLPQGQPDAMTKFRNDVIHKGKISSKQEAANYGQQILDFIVPVLRELKTRNPKEVSKVIGRHVFRMQKQITGSPNTSFLSIATTISLTRGTNEPQPNLERTLQELQRKRRRSKWLGTQHRYQQTPVGGRC